MDALTRLVWRITNQGLLNKLFGKLRGLRRAADLILALYIKEIDILTPEKLAAVRRLRQQLDQ